MIAALLLILLITAQRTSFALAQDSASESPHGRERAIETQDDSDTEEVLSRLMQYEQRILKLEKKDGPSPFVPEGDDVSRDRGGQGTGEIFQGKGSATAGAVALKDLARDKAELEKRVAELETSLKNSDELVRELKKVRPSGAELTSLESQVKDRDQQIKKYQDRIAEFERSANLPRLREEEAVSSAAKASEVNRILKIENSKLLDQLAKFKQQIIDLTDRLEASGRREDHLKKQLSRAEADSSQTEEALKSAQKASEANKILEQEKAKLLSETAGLRTELDTARKDLEKRSTSEAALAALRKERDDAKVRITELEELAKGKAALESKAEKTALQIQELTKQRDAIVKERDELLGSTNELRQEFAKLRDERSNSQTKISDLSSVIKSKDEEIAEVNRQLSKSIQESKDCEANRAQIETTASRVRELENALIKAKNDLLLKETEVRMLSGGAARNSAPALDSPAILPENTTTSIPAASKPSMQDLANRITPIDKAVTPTTTSSDVLIIEVIAKKVNLRSGPGNEHAAVMQVQAGTQLTVESKEGDWYRVLTPTGSRAYIRGDVVRHPGSGPAKPVARAAPQVSPESDLEAFSLDDKPRPGSRDDEDTRAFESLKEAIRKGSAE